MADFFWCLVSIGVAAVSNPVLLITCLWPYIALLASFTAFVFWNGGVVLGKFFDPTSAIANMK